MKAFIKNKNYDFYLFLYLMQFKRKNISPFLFMIFNHLLQLILIKTQQLQNCFIKLSLWDDKTKVP